MKLSIIIPVYNESATAEEVMQRVTRATLPRGLSTEVIVVDDGSNAATLRVLDELAAKFSFQLLHLIPNQGKGQALREGIAACTGDIVLFQDCDLEYDPADYRALVTPILERQADIVYGSRFLAPHGKPQMSPVFFAANRVLTAFSNLCSGVRLTDMETGYKVFRGDLIRKLVLEEAGFGIEPEITAKVAKLVKRERIRLVEVAIRYQARTYRQGKKIGFADGLRSLWCIARYNLSSSRF